MIVSGLIALLVELFDDADPQSVLDFDAPGEFFTVRYPLSPDLTNGRDTIRLRFDSVERGRVGRVFDCRTLRR